ncbi:Rieske [Christiangramia fulva]|uniref:Rieske n=1 Tax=Christiangramia fulva TaxID=2126553 RepID=A0A2R3Z103_9FLAO|nr:Rieske (2Fe-2S) protein [Christiangramia fulva]AVR43941.1 Rieske [Christiangramia fulva]
MKRIEFISSVGKGVILICSGSCVLAGCSSGGDDSEMNNGGNNGGTDNKVSISLSTLSDVGDQTTKNGILFFRVGAGNTTNDFIATEAICPHQGGKLVWIQNDMLIECQLHHSQYEADGDVIQGPQNASGSTRDLKIYSISISGDTLTATKS